MKFRKAIATILLAVLSLHEIALPFIWQQPKLIIAIVDFRNTSEDTRLNYLEQTIPEALSTTLAKSGQLEIVERSRLEAALQEMEMSMLGVVDEKTAAELGRAVGATSIMVGSFVSISGTIRINARLIDVQTARVLTAESVQGPEAGEGIFNLMDQIAMAMQRQLLGTPAPAMPVQPQPQAQQQTPLQPAPQPQVVVVQKKSSGLFWLLVLGLGAAGAYYYYLEELAPTTVDITVNIQP